MPDVLVDGVRLHYEHRGRGRPVLLLHGFSSSYRGTWEDTGWVELLVEHNFETIGFDARGHGRSHKPHDPAAYLSEHLVADAVAVLDEVGAERVDVVGYSMGGGTALQLARDHLGRVRSVVVGGVGDAALHRLADADEIEAIADALAVPSERAVRSPQARRLRRNALAGDNDLRALAACMRNGRGWPGGLADLDGIAVPVLLAVAENDQYMRDHAELVAGLPEVEVVSLSDVDHHGAIRDPRFKQATLEFLA